MADSAAGGGLSAARDLGKAGKSSGAFSHAAAAQKAITEAHNQLAVALRHLLKVHGAAAEVSTMQGLEAQAAKVATAVTKLAGAQAAELESRVIRVVLQPQAAGEGTARAVIELC
tara:strand:- start:40 stop:384 length:345 start_codon:yes stop_codon:yes gene_type:complete